MAISFVCSSCKHALRVKDELAGRKVKCPKCGAVAAVPAVSTPAVAAGPPRKAPRQAAEEAEDDEPRSKRQRRTADDEEDERRPRKKKRKKSNTGLLIGLGAGGAALVAVIVLLVILLSGHTKERPKAPPRAPVAVAPQQQAPQPVAPKKEPGPNVNLSGIGRFWTEQEVKNNLRNLGIAYKNYVAENGKGPPDRKTLSPYYENNGPINEALEKGWFTIAWKAGPRQMPDGASNTILAYEPDADRQGNRWVLMGDGSVHRMPIAEFEKTPKASK